MGLDVADLNFLDLYEALRVTELTPDQMRTLVVLLEDRAASAATESRKVEGDRRFHIPPEAYSS